MWTVIYVSQSPEMAEKLSEALYDNGIISKLRRDGKNKENKCCYEILVPGTEMEAAQDLIIEEGLF